MPGRPAYLAVMKARVPMDVDLEDQLIYGLSPTRFGYVAIAVLAAMVVWAGGRPPVVPRVALALVLLAIGAGAGWVTFRGRHLDDWALDLARFLVGNHRIRIERANPKPPD